MTVRVGRFRSRHHVTSVRSPNVHTIAIPVPLSGAASGWAYTGMSTWNSGEWTVRPTRSAYRGSDGWHTSATQAGSSSGRVVSTSTSSKRRRWYAPGRSRYSSSACATAVENVASHSVGASARYASPRARLRRNARWLAVRARSPIVAYWYVQSTDSPTVRHNVSYAFSSSAVSRTHSSMKLRRETGTGAGPGDDGGTNAGSYGSDGSHVMP